MNCLIGDSTVDLCPHRYTQNDIVKFLPFSNTNEMEIESIFQQSMEIPEPAFIIFSFNVRPPKR